MELLNNIPPAFLLIIGAIALLALPTTARKVGAIALAALSTSSEHVCLQALPGRWHSAPAVNHELLRHAYSLSNLSVTRLAKRTDAASCGYLSLLRLFSFLILFFKSLFQVALLFAPSSPSDGVGDERLIDPEGSKPVDLQVAG